MRDRMSDTEAIMWAVEKDPALRSDFVNVTILDRSPDMDRLRTKIEAGLETLPRLRQRVVSPPLRLAPPEWIDDPEFDLDYHVRRVAVPPPGGQRELLDLAAVLASTPFDRARPLWEFIVVEGLEGGRSALLQRVHHTVIDGVGGVKFSLMLLDLERDPAPPVDERTPAQRAADTVNAEVEALRKSDPLSRTSPLDVVSGALTHVVARAAGALRGTAMGAGALARHPEQVPAIAEQVVKAAASVRRQVLVPGAALSPVMTARSLGRRFELFSASLPRAKAAATALGGTINDIFVTGVAGALGLYHDRMGHSVDELRMAMPVNLRDGDSSDATGNQFAPTRVVVPVAPKDPAERFRLIHGRLRELRAEPAIALAAQLAGFLNLLPTSILVSTARSQARTIDFATSNLRGAPFDLFIAGARIEGNHPMGPLAGCGVNVTMLSYRDSLDMGLNIDPAAITDPGALLECMHESFDSLLAVSG